LFGDAPEIGRAIKREILKKTGLVASVGVAPSKFLAKLASDLDKPDGFRVILPDEVRTILDPLPVSKVFGVGPRTAKRLESLGVATIGQLASRPRDEVVREFGATGAWIHDLAHGIDTRRVTPRREEKSHGMERTFPTDVADREELRLALLSFCEEVAFGLRDKGLRGRTVTLKARYGDFTTITRTKTLSAPTNLGPRIYTTARELLDRIPPGPLRLLGVSMSALSDVRVAVQESLFGDVEPDARGLRAKDAGRARAGETTPLLHGTKEAGARQQRAAESMDKLRKKFGRTAIVRASLLGRERIVGRDGTDGTATPPAE